MKHQIVRNIAFALLALGLAATASAQGHHTCSIARVAGTWGYSLQGTFFPPNPAGGTLTVLVAFVGTYTVDEDGSLSGTQTSNANGNVSHDVLAGTLTMNPDCTGTQTVEIYNQSGTLLRSAVWAVVFMDDARESRGTFTELKLPNGTIVPAIAIAQGKKVGRL